MLNLRVSSSLGLITSGVVLIFTVSGCGFKSDLFLPKSEAKDELFEADDQPMVDTDEKAMLEPSMEPIEESEQVLPSAETTPGSEGVLVDITSEAIDGRILLSHGDDTSEVDASEGVPVSIDDLFLEGESNTQ